MPIQNGVRSTKQPFAGSDIVPDNTLMHPAAHLEQCLMPGMGEGGRVTPITPCFLVPILGHHPNTQSQNRLGTLLFFSTTV